MTEFRDPAPDVAAMMPKHVAIIMDGNGRWARQRGLPRTEGHRKGVESVRRAVRASMELGISHLTLFSFSSENWSRPVAEINDLMGLLRRFISRDLADLHKHNVRIRVIGESGPVESDIVKMIADAETLTRGNAGLNLTVAFNYGARSEITQAARSLAERVARGELQPQDINQAEFERHLETYDLPDPDILIRTSGEQRLSNFLLWQLAYSELVFVDEYWPDFTKETLEKAIADFHSRDRRFGGLGAHSTGRAV